MPINQAAPVRDGQNVTVVHEVLRREILTGRLPAGETSQAELARRFGVGRTPLREAIRLLQSEGLVISEPNRRVRIAGLSAADVEELLLMRIALEAVALRCTVPLLGARGIAELEGLTAQMDYFRRKQDHSGYSEPHRQFHARLVTAGGERVTRAIEELSDHSDRYQMTFGATSPAVWDERRAEHRDILEAVAAGDADLAVLRLAEHYTHTALLVLAGLGGNHEPVRLRQALVAIAPGSQHWLDEAPAPATTADDQAASGAP